MAISSQLKQELLALGDRDRAKLAAFLLDSLDQPQNGESEIESRWYDEAEARLKAFEEGRLEAISLDDAIQEATRAFQ